MSTMKKCQIIILPTNTRSNIRLMKTIGLQYHPKLIFNNTHHTNPQHLYFLSDEEIKEGDWIIVNHGIFVNKIIQNIHGETGSVVGSKEYLNKNSKKIIATTDSSIRIGQEDKYSRGISYYPQPSNEFLEVFVKEYNKGNVIKEVMVEYEEFTPNNKINLNDGYHKSLKINSKDNTITIKKIKDSWTREEVEILIRTAYNNGYHDRDIDIGHGSNIRYSLEQIDK